MKTVNPKSLMRLMQLLLATSVLGLFAWLCFQGSTKDRRQLIEQLLHEGRLATLTKDQAVNLESRLNVLVRAAAFTNRVNLNQPFDTNCINFFLTTAQSSRITGCGLGNAVYDAGIDAVFIDSEILFPTRIQSTFASASLVKNDLPDETAISYFEYVILHELGHRALHRNVRGAFDIVGNRDEKVRKIESEADSFAIERLAMLQVREANGSRRISSNGRFKAPPGLQSDFSSAALVNLCNMSYEMTRSCLFGDTPYSPFTTDAGHPAFVDRMVGLLEQMLRTSKNPKIRVYIQLVFEDLKRIQMARGRLKREIFSQESILSAHVTERELFIIGANGGLYCVPIPSVTAAPIHEALILTSLNATTTLSKVETHSLADGIWCNLTPQSPIVIVPKRGFYDLHTHQWSNLSMLASGESWDYFLSSSNRWIAVSGNANSALRSISSENRWS